MNLNLPQSDKLGEFKGLVECYENGKLKWARENKITSIGRLALMSTIVRTTFNAPENQNWLNMQGWRFEDGTSRIAESRPASVCAFAVGNGGALNDIGIPTASKFTDRGLNNILPFGKRTTITSEGFIGKRSDYIDIYGKVYGESEEDTWDTDSLIEKKLYYINNVLDGDNDVGISEFSTKEYIFFKKAAQIHRPSFFDMSSSSVAKNVQLTRFVKGNNSSFNKVYCTVARLELVVKGSELLNAQSDGNDKNVNINELSLYLLTPHGNELENKMFTSYIPEPEDEQKPYSVTEDKFFLPIQFSRVTFPSEVFNSIDKTITFVYSIFV